MRSSFLGILCLFWALIPLVDSQCASVSIPSSLATLTQYQLGSAGDAYYGHFLVNGDASFQYENSSATAVYELTADGLAAATDNCTSSCLTSITAYYSTDSNNLTLMMLRPSDESLYPNYTSLGLPSIYCATVSGYCGATKPLYQFHSSAYNDYYANIEKTNSSNATYTVAMMGLPLCYLWVPTTTTTTTTTTVATTTTTSSNATTTTTTSSANLTTTTAATSSTNSTTTTATSSTNSTTTTATSSTNSTTASTSSTNSTTASSSSTNSTTPASTSGAGSTGSQSTDGNGSTGSTQNNGNGDDEKGWWHAWRVPLIVTFCLIGAAFMLCLTACLTCWFLGSASVAAAKPYSPPPIYDSPSPPQLPPAPIQAPAMNPFTVGLPPTVGPY